jgi:hypothetical protein
MTIQRQYQLPNCTLSLEGMSHARTDAEHILRPSLDILMRFECHFINPAQSLVGGMDLLQSIINATNQCAQEWMSGVHHIQTAKGHHLSDQIRLQPLENSAFQLTVPSALLHSSQVDLSKYGDDTDLATKDSLQLQLSTLQLFDLVEALDQLMADQQTLPNLVSDLRPLSRRQAIQAEPLVKRAAPLILGTGSLAITIAAFFFLPVPKVSPPPEELLRPSTPSEPATSPSPAGASPPPISPSPTGSPPSPEP